MRSAVFSAPPVGRRAVPLACVHWVAAMGVVVKAGGYGLRAVAREVWSKQGAIDYAQWRGCGEWGWPDAGKQCRQLWEVGANPTTTHGTHPTERKVKTSPISPRSLPVRRPRSESVGPSRESTTPSPNMELHSATVMNQRRARAEDGGGECGLCGPGSPSRAPPSASP